MQYPDIISFTDSSDAVYDENTGQWTPGSPGSTVTSECRFEEDGRDVFVTTQDGKQVKRSGRVYLPYSSADFREGVKVTITKVREGNTSKVFKQNVLRFERHQMNCELWV